MAPVDNTPKKARKFGQRETVEALVNANPADTDVLAGTEELQKFMKLQRERNPNGTFAKKGSTKRRTFKVLSIDGGGIRGIVALQMLVAMEDELGKPVGQCFDLISGTSTGGIIGLGLSLEDPQNPGKPLYSARDLLRLYLDNGEKIFKKGFLQHLPFGTTAAQLMGPKYSSKNLRKVMSRYFGDFNLNDALTNVMITAYDIEGQKPFFFKNRMNPALRARDRNFRMRDVCVATSSAPTYFPPHELFTVAPSDPATARVPKTAERFAMIDGGVFHNNPVLAAAVDAEKLIAGRDMDMMVISLGTGNVEKPLPIKKAKKLGIIGWSKRIVGIMTTGQAKAASYHTDRILGQDHMRFNTMITGGVSEEFDDGSKKNMQALVRLGQRMVDKARADGRFEKMTDRIRADIALGPIDHGLNVTSTAMADPSQMRRYHNGEDFNKCFKSCIKPAGIKPAPLDKPYNELDPHFWRSNRGSAAVTPKAATKSKAKKSKSKPKKSVILRP